MNNFAVLDIDYRHDPTAILITITTNNPCHLTSYYTDKEPGRHKTSRRERGIDLPWGAYFCFVAWKSVEQMEPGDTITHTFEIPDWLFCETKWLAFRGTVSTQLSPSVSPIFNHHHSGILPFCNLSFEDYPITPGVPPCWLPDSYGAGTPIYERDPINIQHGLYSCRITALGLDFSAKLYQRRWTSPYLNKSVKFTFNWFGGGRGGITIGPSSIGFNYGGGWHTWTKTLSFGATPTYLLMRISTGGRGSSWTQHSWDNITIEIL